MLCSEPLYRLPRKSVKISVYSSSPLLLQNINKGLYGTLPSWVTCIGLGYQLPQQRGLSPLICWRVHSSDDVWIARVLLDHLVISISKIYHKVLSNSIACNRPWHTSSWFLSRSWSFGSSHPLQLLQYCLNVLPQSLLSFTCLRLLLTSQV